MFRCCEVARLRGREVDYPTNRSPSRKHKMSRGRRNKRMMLGTPYFGQMFRGHKTIDARPGYRSYERIKAGVRLLVVFFSRLF